MYFIRQSGEHTVLYADVSNPHIETKNVKYIVA